MRNKAPLVLMEQTVMVLVFALAAAICVRAFALSDSISKTTAARDAAVLRSESAAEIYKEFRGDGASAVKRYGGSAANGVWTVYWDADWKQVQSEAGAAYRMKIQSKGTRQARMEGAEVTVVSLGKKGKTLVSFPLAWQEADDNG